MGVFAKCFTLTMLQSMVPSLSGRTGVHVAKHVAAVVLRETEPVSGLSLVVKTVRDQPMKLSTVTPPAAQVWSCLSTCFP